MELSMTAPLRVPAPEGPALRTESGPGALYVTMSRPERQNALSEELLTGLHAALDAAEGDPDCHALVLQGEGGVFCAGMDFADAQAGAERAPGSSGATGGGEEFWRLLDRFTTTPLAVVACVDGRALGGGVGLVAASDFVWATPGSSFALPEALWGLLPCCVLPFLIRRVGFQPAYAMTLGTLPVDAARAERMHLVDEVSDDPRLPLRRLLSRLTKVDASTRGALKRYVRPMSPVSSGQARAAVAEFARLFADPVVADRIGTYVRDGRFPWER
jgi:polyketide biosynthesis enoyl-CoA hydratase PksH